MSAFTSVGRIQFLGSVSVPLDDSRSGTISGARRCLRRMTVYLYAILKKLGIRREHQVF